LSLTAPSSVQLDTDATAGLRLAPLPAVGLETAGPEAAEPEAAEPDRVGLDSVDVRPGVPSADEPDGSASTDSLAGAITTRAADRSVASRGRFDDEDTDGLESIDLEAAPPAAAPVRQPSAHKKSMEAAWAAWQASGGASEGSEFLDSVSSWTQGTAAQLLRQPWAAGLKRPTSADVEERLRHNLGLAARGDQSTHLQALVRARDTVIDELRKAQRPARPARAATTRRASS